MHRLQIKGQRFNRLVAIRPVRKNKKSVFVWEFRCDCGTRHKAIPANVKNGHIKSCGCWQRESRYFQRRTHGEKTRERTTTEYGTWQAMKRRCLNPNVKDFKHYGGRGIRVCKRWKTDWPGTALRLERCRYWRKQSGRSSHLASPRWSRGGGPRSPRQRSSPAVTERRALRQPARVWYRPVPPTSSTPVSRSRMCCVYFARRLGRRRGVTSSRARSARERARVVGNRS